MRYVNVAMLRPDKVEFYRHYHDNIYPEVAAGLRASGVTSLSIYQVPSTTQLVLILEAPDSVVLDTALGPGSVYRSNSRVKEWEEMMETEFHSGWTRCEMIHSSDVNWPTKDTKEEGDK